MLEPELLHQLFATIRNEFLLTPNAEITMECAPGQIDDAVLQAMVACGVNRVSLGVQSFIDKEAATSGRLHNRATTLADIDRLRAAGIQRLSLDLIAGLPHQTLASWDESLDLLLSTGVDHASVYMLEVDDESRLGRELLEGGARYHSGAVPKDDTIATMFEQAIARLAASGLQQYELSNFAVAGHESKHNLKYWTRDPYLGVGVDAHSMLLLRDPTPGEGAAVRFGYDDSLDSFLDTPEPWEPDHLTRHAELEEAWFLGLRLSSGVDLNDLRNLFGRESVDRFLPTLQSLAGDGLVHLTATRATLTVSGKLLSNEAFQAILEVGDEEFCQTI